MYHILIIDDEPIVKIALRSILPWEEHGFQICAAASNGEEALALVEQYHPQIIITDLKMPKMDGIELIRNLKGKEYDGEILVLSNYEDFEYVRNALLLGAVDYMLKIQIGPEILLDRLNKAVEKLNSRNIAHNAQEQTERLQEKLLKEFFTGKQSLEDFRKEHPAFDFSYMKKPCSICCLSFEHYLSDEKKRRPLSGSLIQSTILDALQGLALSHIIFITEYQLLILLSQEELGPEEIALKQFVGKLPNRFQLYQSLSPMIIYYWNIEDYDQARVIYSGFSDIWLLRFYGDISIADARKVRLIHYLSFIQYKDLAREIHSNRLEELDKSLDLLSSIVIRCKEENIYPEILRMLFIKALEFLEFLEKSVTIQMHDFLSETKEAIYYCTSSQELLSNMEVSLHEIFTPPPLPIPTFRAIRISGRKYYR